MKYLKNPPSEFRPAPFWFWNHDLDDDELKWQIQQMHEKGIGGFVIHSRPGLLIPYMSEKWLKRIETAVKEAQGLGMLVWLYDEDAWPSGTASGRVVEEHPEYRMSQVYPAHEFIVAGPAKLSKGIPVNDEIIFIQAMSWDKKKGYATVRIKELNKFIEKKRIVWDVPKGKWKVIILARSFYRGGFFGSYLDLLNEDAVAKFIEYTHKVYTQRFYKYMGKTIRGIFTDEPGCNYTTVKRAIPWTSGLLKRFKELHGYDLTPHILALYYNIGPQTTRIRCDYYATMTDMYIRAFFKQIYNYCEKVRIKSIGHVVSEDDLFENVNQQGDFFQTVRYMHWGGVDSLCHHTLDSARSIISTKMASSAAHLLDKPRVSNEAFGLADAWKVNLRSLKVLADWQVILGTNYFIPHAFYYSIQGFRKWECPPGEFYQLPFWKYYKIFADYLSRLCYLFSGGRHIAKIAILYPVKSICAKRDPGPTPLTRKIQEDFEKTSLLLMKLHYDFDYVTEELIQNAEIENGIITIKNDNGKKTEKFELLLLASVTTLSLKTVKKMEEFYNKSGKILVTNFLPTESVENGDDPVVSNFFKRKEIIFINGTTSMDQKTVRKRLKKYINEIVKQDVIISQDGRDIDEVVYCHYLKEGSHLYFFSNTSEKMGYRVDVSLNVIGALQYIDVLEGKIKPWEGYWKLENGMIKFNLDFEPTQSHLIIVSPITKMKSQGKDRLTKRRKAEVILLSKEWNFKTDKLNSLPLTDWKLKIDGRSVVSDYDNLFYLYEGCLQVESLPTKARLLIDGLVNEKIWHNSTVKPVRIKLNGNEIKGFGKGSYLDHYIFEVDVSKLLKNGRNDITIESYGGLGGLFEPVHLGHALILIGTFALHEKNGQMVISKEAGKIRYGSWCEQGYPYYSGIGVYEQEIQLPVIPRDKNLKLCLSKVANLSDIWVNDKQVKVLAWEPFKTDLTRYLKPGKNKITIKVTNTLHNLLLKEPYPSGLLEEVKILVCE